MKIVIGISIAVLMVVTVLIIKRVSQESRSLPVIASFADKEIKKIFGEDAVHKILNMPFPHLKVSSANGEITGYLFSSCDLNVINHGYKTEVKVIIAVGPGKKIKQIILHNIKESPKQVEKIKKSVFFGQWKEKCLGDLPPDTVTGATKTSTAINKSVTELLRKINSL